MGAWGLLNFENDTALDFVADLEEKGIMEIKTTIDIINSIGEDAYLDADLCCEALVAIEYLAAAKGNKSTDFPEEASAWLTDSRRYDLLDMRYIVAKSKDAIDRIQHNSELKELWEDTDEFDAWVNVLTDLNTRIS